MLVACVARASATHPRPRYDQYASFARWLVHESDYAVVSTHHGSGDVFGNIMSVSDGDGYEDSTGVIYTYLPGLDTTCQDLVADDRVALTFSEMALDGGRSGGCFNSTAENPPCGRLVVTGRLTPVPEEHRATALKYLFSRHPIMKEWSAAHVFQPFWMAPENITSFFLIDFFGGSMHPTVQEYLAAPWFRHDVPAGGFVCHTCGHVYDAAKDGGGKAFEDLPDSWTCPVCGAPKSAFEKHTFVDGNAVWTHFEGQSHPPQPMHDPAVQF